MKKEANSTLQTPTTATVSVLEHDDVRALDREGDGVVDKVGDSVGSGGYDLADTLITSQMNDVTEHPKALLAGNNMPIADHSHSSMAHFKIIDILGKGGMGAVYKAKDLLLERFVAIKMLRLNKVDQPLILTEAKTISQLNHPNIVTLYDIARDEEANFIVMEWIDGQPLNTLIPSTGLAVTTVLAYSKQIVAALACAHQQHIIHRDIKPQNILVDLQGRIKILDFGIAALLAPSATTKSSVHAPAQPTASSAVMTASGAISGSPQYMSPEQIAGQQCDARSDLFSLGIVLYEMLAGGKPFLGLNVKQISQAITNGHYTPLTALNIECHIENTEAIRSELIGLVDKLLQTVPEQRYQSAEELAQDIDLISAKVDHKKNWWQRQHWLTKTLIILPVLTMLSWSLRSVLFPPSTQELIARQLQGSKKVAFVPFTNISGDPVLQLFSDGIATMLSSDLAEVGYQQDNGSTWVLPMTEISQLKEPSIATIYNKYGVDFIVTGTIQHMGSTRSLHLSLINGADGRQLKSTHMTLDAKQLFSTQQQIRQQVMSLLDWQLPSNLRQQFAQQKPAFDGAYQHYLQGQGYLYRFDHSNNIAKAVESFQSAVQVDSQYSAAYVGLAQAQLRQFITTKSPHWLALMEQTVTQLQQRDAQHELLTYLQAQSKLHQGEYQQAAQLFNQSIINKPQFVTAYTGLADAYIALRQTVKAEKVLAQAYQLLPNNNLVLAKFGVFYYGQGNYQQAIHYFTLLAQQAPNNFTAHLNISACHYLNGNMQEAISAAERALAIQPSADVYANLGTIYFILTKYDQAVTAYESMIALSDSDYIKWGNLADAYRFANNDKSTAAFEQAIVLAEQALKVNALNKNALASLAYYYANVGYSEKTDFYAEQITASDTGANLFLMAAAYTRLEKYNVAVKYLRFAVNNDYSMAEITTSPLLDSLKQEPEYQALIGKHIKGK